MNAGLPHSRPRSAGAAATVVALARLVTVVRYHHLDAEIRTQVRGGFIVLCGRCVALSWVHAGAKN
ncbi:hypothetical protein [Saccharopolyspora sp. ASAGF58]|uniref:hypothetical protein n=1 Tax=Saccharopolyspora sp. ASAGF58 TaxID=2719023 RepID=UPI00143FCFB0|nr:hypothetical protein [Saccharopolyspora sp. ASAGF58]QIZ33454.1 hypothetical protein FDZ84_00225 [Saccharopolyspora sp. ASAGF58]